MRKLLFAVLALSALGAAPQDRKGLQIVWVDVEGGAATLIVTPAGESLLMDCGWPGKRDPERIKKAADACGAKRIDHYITSHFHTDHWGGIEGLAALLPIGKCYDHGFPGPEAKDVDAKIKEAYVKVSEGKRVILKPGETLPLRGVQVKILSANGIVLGEEPGAPQIRPCTTHEPMKEDTSDNARSLGFLLTFGDFKFLDMGDLTWNVEHKLVCPKNLIGTVDVYQVTHHGLDISNHPALLQAVAPAVAVMNNGAKKGGTAATYRRLKGIESIKDIFQLHRNVATGDADNAPSLLLANDDEKCAGAVVQLTVDPSGKSYTVEIPSKKTSRTHRTR